MSDSDISFVADPIVVVGPGRCGTSAVAGLLHHLGVFMGDRFVPAHETNPYGHWEDLEFLEPNDDFLMKRNITEVEWRRAIEKVIERRIRLNRPWGWKDPRTCQLIPQYLDILPYATFVRCLRPKATILDSFMRAYSSQGWTPPMAQQLVEAREEALDRHLPQGSTVLIQFEDLKANREESIRALVEQLRLSVTTRQLKVAIDFIRPDEPGA